MQKCVGEEETEEILAEVHEGACGSHIGSRALTAVVLRQGYFWPTLKEEATKMVNKCKSCQEHARIQRVPSEYVHSTDYPIPFAVWGIDLIGALPLAPGGLKFCVVAVDYFTKWIEAEPLSSVTSENIRRFVWKNIICRFGCPRVLVADNGSQFTDGGFQDFAEQYGISLHFAPVAHPQSNGQVEVSNRTLKDGLKKRLGKAKGKWPGELPHVLWSYRTTPRKSTGETPFSLVFGTEAVIPIEVINPSLRTEVFSQVSNEEGLRTNLDLLEQKREEAELRRKAFQQRTANSANSKVKSKNLKVGDLVLRQTKLGSRRPEGGVFAPNWEGPYKIAVKEREGVFQLEDPEGLIVQNTYHSEALRKYFV